MPVVQNQIKPFDHLPTSNDPGEDIYPIAEVINYEILTPLSHWGASAKLPPPGTFDRLRQLREFRRLYDGDMDVIFKGFYPVRVNLFRAVALNLADLLLAFPPEIVSGPDGIDILNRDLDTMLPGAISDLVRYGTCLVRAYRNDEEPHIEAPTPEGWFPALDGDAVVTELADRYEVRLLREDSAKLLTYEADDEAQSREPDGINANSAMGKLIESRPIANPIQGQSVFPVALRPGGGRWGQSMFPTMYPLVTEICRRMTKLSGTLNDHADPMLVLKRDPSTPQGRIKTAAPGDENQFEAYSRRVFLDKWRRQYVTVLGEEFEAAEYLTWDAQAQATFGSMDHTLRALYSSNPIMPLVMGLISGNDAVVGGMSIRKVFSPTWLFTLRIMNTLKMALADACEAALGAPVEIEWPDAMGKLDVLTIVQEGNPDTADDDNPADTEAEDAEETEDD